MTAVARVSRKIPTPRPSLAEERERPILFLLSRLNESSDRAADRHCGSTHRWPSSACSSQELHRLIGVYGNGPGIKLINPKIQLIRTGYQRAFPRCQG